MIGVVCHTSEAAAAAEFFELFKTEWEPYDPTRRYDIVLESAKCAERSANARLTIRYADARGARSGGTYSILRTGSGELPVYQGYVPLETSGRTVATDAAGNCGGFLRRRGSDWEAQIGYDLFAEIRFLLTQGQPEECAQFPAIERHIELLRELIRLSGQSCLEVRPAPKGYRFVAALTHDVDHPSLRMHGLDRTACGFLLRALLGSIGDFARGRSTWRRVRQNWRAAAKHPFVCLGWASDPWLDFVRYPDVERGAPSTFFVLPLAKHPGRALSGEGAAPAKRAAAYSAADLAQELATLRERCCEIALHGIDAWVDSGAAARERASAEQAVGGAIEGVRMHWLYWNAATPERLEQAGFDYDSTFGYNRTVGFRAGTAQAFRPLGVHTLLELPLILMDTALFFPRHLHLSPAEAWRRVGALLEHLERFGGCLTVNWHDRSLFPERMWGDFYRDLLAELERRGAWITNASGAVRWFRRRRQAFCGSLPSLPDSNLPDLEIRRFQPAAENIHEFGADKTPAVRAG